MNTEIYIEKQNTHTDVYRDTHIYTHAHTTDTHTQTQTDIYRYTHTYILTHILERLAD